MNTVVYDGDCGFCTQAALWLRQRSQQLEIVAWQDFDYEQLGLSQSQVSSAVYLVDSAGAVHKGAAAVGRTLLSMSFPWKVIGALLVTPPISWIARAAYPIVARNRHRLPGATQACRIEPDTRHQSREQ